MNRQVRDGIVSAGKVVAFSVMCYGFAAFVLWLIPDERTRPTPAPIVNAVDINRNLARQANEELAALARKRAKYAEDCSASWRPIGTPDGRVFARARIDTCEKRVELSVEDVPADWLVCLGKDCRLDREWQSSAGLK